jgi:tetratricopeptide (TPR) repeat protein
VEYLDFDLQIERLGDKYRVRVLDSPSGQATGEFAVPFSEIELENFLLRMGRARRRVRRLESPETQAAKTMGGQLFGALFTGEVRDALLGGLREAQRQDAGLRIRMRLSDAPELADLPWEYLYNPAVNRFLALSKETPIVRFLELPEPVRALVVKPPLRVLAMVASPSDLPILDVEQEWARLRDALGDLHASQKVVIERLEKATLSALQRRLKDDLYHVFHFVGHGGFDESAQDGILILEDQSGRGRAVSGQTLGTLLYDHKSMRLVVLNACEGARASRTDPFAGAAQSLIQQGVPAVIAMQFEISDDAAILFAHEFYDSLARAYPVDAALGEARRAIFANDNELEWGTPVLYMRAPDGRIFDVADGRAQTTPRSAPQVSGAEAQAQRLAGLYTRALAAFYTESWEKAIVLFTQILAQQPDYEDVGSKLTEARRASHLADLYAEARLLHDARQWDATISVLERIATIEPEYPDPDGLQASARDKQRAVDLERQLAALYAQGLRSLDSRAWADAITAFEEIQRLSPDYEAANGLLTRARQQKELSGLPPPPAPVIKKAAPESGPNQTRPKPKDLPR